MSPTLFCFLPQLDAHRRALLLLCLQLVLTTSLTQASESPAVVLLAEGGGRYTNALMSAGGLLLVWNREESGGGAAVMATVCAKPDCALAQHFVLWDGSGAHGGDPRFISASISAADDALYAAFSKPELVLLRCEVPLPRLPRTLPACSASLLSSVPTAYPTIVFPAVAASQPAPPLVAHFEPNRDAGGALRLVRCRNTACTLTAPMLSSAARGFDVGKYVHGALSSDGIPTFAYLNASAGDRGLSWSAAMLMRCADTGCSSWEGLEEAESEAASNTWERRPTRAMVVDDVGVQVGAFTQLLYPSSDDEGGVLLLYFAEEAGEMRVARCSRETTAGECQRKVVAQVGIQPYGEFPSLVASPASGLGVASFFNQTSQTSGALRLLVCCNAVCAHRQVYTLAAGPCGYGRDSSIAFGPNRTYVSFLDYNQDGEDKRLRVAVLPHVAGSECFSPGSQGAAQNPKLVSHAFRGVSPSPVLSLPSTLRRIPRTAARPASSESTVVFRSSPSSVPSTSQTLLDVGKDVCVR